MPDGSTMPIPICLAGSAHVLRLTLTPISFPFHSIAEACWDRETHARCFQLTSPLPDAASIIPGFSVLPKVSQRAHKVLQVL